MSFSKDTWTQNNTVQGESVRSAVHPRLTVKMQEWCHQSENNTVTLTSPRSTHVYMSPVLSVSHRFTFTNPTWMDDHCLQSCWQVYMPTADIKCIPNMLLLWQECRYCSFDTFGKAQRGQWSWSSHCVTRGNVWLSECQRDRQCVTPSIQHDHINNITKKISSAWIRPLDHWQWGTPQFQSISQN